LGVGIADEVGRVMRNRWEKEDRSSFKKEDRRRKSRPDENGTCLEEGSVTSNRNCVQVEGSGFCGQRRSDPRGAGSGLNTLWDRCGSSDGRGGGKGSKRTTGGEGATVKSKRYPSNDEATEGMPKKGMGRRDDHAIKGGNGKKGGGNHSQKMAHGGTPLSTYQSDRGEANQ